MQCALCPNIAHTELQAISRRSVCIACATAIAEALPHLKTQPCRRQTICMRLGECGVSVMATDQRIMELVEYGVTDEQLRGACDMAKERIGQPNFGYVLSILRNERQRKEKALEKAPEPQKAEPVVALEDWQRLGFANQADYECWQFSYDMERRKGRKITEAESRKAWLSEAI